MKVTENLYKNRMTNISFNLGAFEPLDHLLHVDLYDNPKLFQPGMETCSLPISAALTSVQHQKSIGSLCKFLLCDSHSFFNLKTIPGFAKNNLATIPTKTLEFVKMSLR